MGIKKNIEGKQETLDKKLKIELAEIEERLKGDFVNPKDMRRKDEIISLLISDGEKSDVRFSVKKGKNPQRVTRIIKYSTCLMQLKDKRKLDGSGLISD